MSMETTNIELVTFQHQQPEYIGELSPGVNATLMMGALASRLTREERTRTIHPDGRRENVAEHGFMVAKVSLAVAEVHYPWMDRGKIALFSLGHDDPEAYVGDTPTDPIANHDPIQKALIEGIGVDKLADDHTLLTPAYVKDIVTYEQQEEYEAQLVRIVDKFTTLLIHIPNQGVTLRENYTYDQFVQATYDKERELLDQYPHFIELIEMRTELALHVGNKYIRDWEE